jgi:hypothetical protein
MAHRMAGFREVEVRPVRGRQRAATRPVRNLARWIMRRFLCRLFQYPPNGILFEKRILSLARK